MDKRPGHIIKDILRLLTLEEINVLASSKKKYELVPLTEILLERMEGEDRGRERKSGDMGKEPGIHGGEEEVEEEMVVPGTEDYKCAESIAAILAEYHFYCREAEKGIFSSDVRKKRRSPKMQMSKLILEEREKSKEVNFKLKRQEILRRYRESFKVNLSSKREGKGECVKLDVSGILIKKKM